MRVKTWIIIIPILLGIFLVPWLLHFYLKAIFATFFLIWAIAFYAVKIKAQNELLSDGVWWVPYFLVAGLGILIFSEKYYTFLSLNDWGNLILCAILLTICAILFFWEWPPWFNDNKTLVTKGKRTCIAYLFFIFGLGIWVYAGGCLINAAWDHSKPTAIDCRVTDKAELSYKYMSDTRYLVFVEPWDYRMTTYSFFVSDKEFKRIVPHSTMVRVWTKEGFFRFKWVKDVKIL